MLQGTGVQPEDLRSSHRAIPIIVIGPLAFGLIRPSQSSLILRAFLIRFFFRVIGDRLAILFFGIVMVSLAQLVSNK